MSTTTPSLEGKTSASYNKILKKADNKIKITEKALEQKKSNEEYLLSIADYFELDSTNILTFLARSNIWYGS